MQFNLNFMCSLISKNNSALILVSFPHQLLHALSALRYYRAKNGIAKDDLVEVFVWSYKSRNHLKGSKYREVMVSALSEFENVKLIIPTYIERSFHLSSYRSLSSRMDYLGKTFSENNVTSFFFSHDASADRTAQIFMQAFSGAKHVCYGDPPGFLHRPYGSGLYGKFAGGNILKSVFWKSRMRGINEIFSDTLSLVAIDLRQNVEITDSRIVRVIPLDILIEVFQKLKRGLERLLMDVSKGINDLDSGNYYLLLTSNFSSSGLMTEDNEILLYADICTTHVPSEGKLLIKLHGGTSHKFAQRLASRLMRNKVDVLPQDAQFLPIELMSDLTSECNILSVSSSSLLISLLSQTKVTHALDSDLINRYFNESGRVYMNQVNAVIEENTSA